MSSTASMARRVLGLFAKHPLPGQVKSRLAAATSPGWASQVAAAFLADLLDRLAFIETRRIVAFTPTDARPYFASAGERFELVCQGDGDLGCRLQRFLGAQMAAGAEAVVVVGADSPTLPLTFIEQAFDRLDAADLVLGPATDGGYYLLGCARRVPPIFENIRWGGSTVLAETIARLAGASCRLSLLPPWYDVDTVDDWRMLRGHLAAIRRAGIDPGVPRTEALCQSDSP
jgi:rSAM/selenodomain-associated transferase 1